MSNMLDQIHHRALADIIKKKNEKREPLLLDVSETLFIGFDHSKDEKVTVLSVIRRVGLDYVYVNTFKDQQAVDLYNKLITVEGINNEQITSG